jgi:hypothetical protein
MLTFVGLRPVDGSYYDNFRRLGWPAEVGGLNPRPCTRTLSRSYTSRLNRHHLSRLTPAAIACASSGQPSSSARPSSVARTPPNGIVRPRPPSVHDRPRASSRRHPPAVARPSSAARVPLADIVRPRPPVVDRPTRLPVIVWHRPPSGHPPAFTPSPRR